MYLTRAIFHDLQAKVEFEEAIMSNCSHKKPNDRKELDTVMKDLDNNQGGAGRHKCPYCAYEEGFKEGYEQAKKTEHK